MKPATSILLVDDDAVFRKVMAGELGRLGYEVVAAGTGEEAVHKVAKLEPEIVLLDLQLPSMNGLDVLKAVRESNPASKVIMLTSHGSIFSLSLGKIWTRMPLKNQGVFEET